MHGCEPGVSTQRLKYLTRDISLVDKRSSVKQLPRDLLVVLAKLVSGPIPTLCGGKAQRPDEGGGGDLQKKSRKNKDPAQDRRVLLNISSESR